MIISFTKDLAKLFNLDLKISRSKKFDITPPLDDWVMAGLWDRPEHVGIALIHKHSLFSLLVASPIKELTHCLDLLYEQLVTLLAEAGLKENKYLLCFDNLFEQINAVKHDDKSTTRSINVIYRYLALCDTLSQEDGIKRKSIDVARMINTYPYKKFNFESSNEVFFELVKRHYADPILINYFDKNTMPTAH